MHGRASTAAAGAGKKYMSGVAKAVDEKCWRADRAALESSACPPSQASFLQGLQGPGTGDGDIDPCFIHFHRLQHKGAVQ